jgi:hypothetical protein
VISTRKKGDLRGHGRAAALALAVAVSATPACFLVTSFGGLHADGSSGGSGNGGGGSGGSRNGASTGASHGSSSGPASGSGTGASGGAGGGCSGSETCAPATDPDWSEPVVFIETSGAAASCNGADPLVTGNSSPEPAACTGCSCDPPIACVALAAPCPDGTCTNCSGGPDIITNAPCSVGGYTAQNTMLTVQTMAAGSCNPRGAGTPPAVTWDHFDVICPPSMIGGGGCGAGGRCVPTPSSGKVCVYRNSPGGPCPDGYSERHQIFQGAGVTCDPCSCDTPTPAVNCNPFAPIQFFSDASCGAFVGSISSTGCMNGISGAGSAVYLPINPGSCNARSAAKISPNGGVDVCCM